MSGFRRALIGSSKKKFPDDERAMRCGVYGNDYLPEYGLIAHIYDESHIGIVNGNQSGVLRDNDIYLEGKDFAVVGVDYDN